MKSNNPTTRRRGKQPRRRRSGTKWRLVGIFAQGLSVLLSLLIQGHELPRPCWRPEAWLEIRSEVDYNARFGGLMYIFLRALGENPESSVGVYFFRPTWDQVRTYEEELRRGPEPEDAVGSPLPSGERGRG